jgi:outer membrane protein TolC
VNEQRLRIVRIEYEQGARADLDTVEVWAQLNSLQQQEQALQMQFQNSGLEVASYMWLEGDVPRPWEGTILPDTNCLLQQFAEINMLQADSLINVARQQHPKLQMLQKKLDVLAIEKRVKTQDLLPKLDLKANLLQKKYDLPKDISTLYMQQNYKVGFDFRMPLFLREARGAVQTTQFKIIETNYELDNTQLQLELKVKSYYNEWVSLKRQLGYFQASYGNNYKLYRGEEARFNIGESTLFVMNSRENKLLESKQKLIELQMKWQKSYVGLLWSTGVLQE